MAARVKKEFLFKEIEREELCFYTVVEGSNIIAENQSCDSVEQCKEELNEVFESLDESSVIVKLSNKKKSDRAKGGRDHKYREFRVGLRSVDSSGAGAGNLSMLERIFALQLELKMRDKDKEKEDLERRIKELEESGNNPMLEKGLNLIAGFLQGQGKTVVAGHEDAPLSSSGATPAERVRAAVSRLAKIDSNCVATLELLADFAEKKPEDYKRFIPVVRGMV